MGLDKYMKIRLNSLPPATPLPFDLYVTIGGRFVHYLRSGDKIAATKIVKFESKAPESFFILAAERAVSEIHPRRFVKRSTDD